MGFILYGNKVIVSLYKYSDQLVSNQEVFTTVRFILMLLLVSKLSFFIRISLLKLFSRIHIVQSHYHILIPQFALYTSFYIWTVWEIEKARASTSNYSRPGFPTNFLWRRLDGFSLRWWHEHQCSSELLLGKYTCTVYISRKYTDVWPLNYK